VCHRTCSVHQDSPRAELLAFGKTQSRSAIVHRTVSGAPGMKRLRTRQLREFATTLRYNSPDMSGVHRTVRCNCGATTTSAPTATCRRIECAPERAEVRHAHAGAPDTLQCMYGAPPVIKAGPASELQQSEP
jgi:hypothetical protein